MCVCRCKLSVSTLHSQHFVNCPAVKNKMLDLFHVNSKDLHKADCNVVPVTSTYLAIAQWQLEQRRCFDCANWDSLSVQHMAAINAKTENTTEYFNCKTPELLRQQRIPLQKYPETWTLEKGSYSAGRQSAEKNKNNCAGNGGNMIVLRD